MSQTLGSKGHCVVLVILFTGPGSRHNSRITYRNAVFVTVIDLNNVESHILQLHVVPNLPWEKVRVDLFTLERQAFLIANMHSSPSS